MALAVRARHPGETVIDNGRTIILCADNDRFTPGNPGVTKAREAALAVGGKILIPPFPEGSTGTDWNDWASLERLHRFNEKENFYSSPSKALAGRSAS